MFLDIGLVLTAIGALGVLYGAAKALWKGQRELRRRWANRKAEKDFYFRSLEIAYRFTKGYVKYSFSQTNEIVSLQDSLVQRRWGIKPASTRTVTLDVEGPDGISVEEVPALPPGEDWKDYLIRYPKPLKKKEAIAYRLFGSVEVLEGEVTNCSHATSHRVDSFVLRVLFTKAPKETPVLRVYNPLGTVLEEHDLSVDPVSLECRWEAHSPRPYFNYAIEWSKHMKKSE